MEILFHGLRFTVADDGILRLTDCGHFHSERGHGIAEIQLAGENKPTHMGAKLIRSSEGGRLRYLSHEMTEDTLCLTRRTDSLLVRTRFYAYADTNALRADELIALRGVAGVGIGAVLGLHLHAEREQVVRLVRNVRGGRTPADKAEEAMDFILGADLVVADGKLFMDDILADLHLHVRFTAVVLVNGDASASNGRERSCHYEFFHESSSFEVFGILFGFNRHPSVKSVRIVLLFILFCKCHR